MFRNIHILLVEDDDVDVEYIQRSFKKRNFNVVVVRVPDGVEALNVLRRQSHLTIAYPYLILLDMQLPRMNGREFLQELRDDAELKGSTVFVLTQSVNEQDRKVAYDAGVAGYIKKDDDGECYQQLVELLKSYLLITFPFTQYLFQEPLPQLT